MHCVDLGESFPTSIYLQNLASIQPRTSLVKFARSPRTGPDYYYYLLRIPQVMFSAAAAAFAKKATITATITAEMANRVSGATRTTIAIATIGVNGGIRRIVLTR